MNLAQEKLYSYIQQAFFDGKKQPTIKKFFGITTRKKESEIPSTSSDSKKVCNKKKEQMNVNTMDYIDEDDVIPSTPPNELVYKKENFKLKTKVSNEDFSKKMPKTDIAELIDIIDGNMNKPKVTHREESFLMEIDRLRKKSMSIDTETSRLYKVGENESESVNSETEMVLSSPTAESKSSKRKITDYFQIKSSKSS